MKYKSQILTQASGSIGGLTASRNKGGQFFRSRAMPVNPNTAAQVVNRTEMHQSVADWRAVLTPAQRDAWRAYAQDTPVTDALGDPRILSGMNAYAKGNQAIRVAFGLTTEDAPTTGGFTAFTASGVTLELAGMAAWKVVTAVNRPAGGGFRLVAYRSALALSDGVSSYKGAYVQTGELNGGGPPGTSDFDLFLGARPEGLAVGQRFAIKILVRDTTVPRFPNIWESIMTLT